MAKAETSPASLGDEPVQSYKTIYESHPMPEGGRMGLVSFIEKVLKSGGVQKLLVELGKPIGVWRKVRQAELSEEVPDVFIDDDLISAIRNVEMEEFIFPQQLSAYEYLYRAFDNISRRRAKVRAVAVNTKKQLAAWLVVDSVNDLYGIEIITHKEIPDGVALVIASRPEDPTEIAFSLKLEMTP